MMQRIAVLVVDALFWLCEVLSHPGGCWLLNNALTRPIMRRAYPIT